MIKFFRKVRATLLAKGNLGGYLTYAVGEIILVVIGILIALQINNWNETQKQHRADIEFLQNLQGEIILDTLALSSQISWYSKLNEDLRTTLDLIDTAKELSPQQSQFISSALAQAEYLLPTPKDFDRNALMLSSGAIKRMDNALHTNYLRYLELFQFNYNLTMKQANSLVTIINNELYPSVDLNFTDSTQPAVAFDLATLKNNRTIQNALQKAIYYREATINLNKPILKRARTLIDQLAALLIDT